jgi:hypothetical protein
MRERMEGMKEREREREGDAKVDEPVAHRCHVEVCPCNHSTTCCTGCKTAVRAQHRRQMTMRESESVCVCVRERERVCVWSVEPAREREAGSRARGRRATAAKPTAALVCAGGSTAQPAEEAPSTPPEHRLPRRKPVVKQEGATRLPSLCCEAVE